MTATGRNRAGAGALAVLLALALPAPGAAAAAQWSDRPILEAPAAEAARDYIVGAWTDGDDCAAAIAFARDGTFVTPEGGEGRWTLDGAELILAGAGGVRTLRIVPLDLDRMDVITEDGSRATSVRCAEEAEPEPAFVALDIA